MLSILNFRKNLQINSKMSLYNRRGSAIQVSSSIDEEEEDRSRRRGSDKWDWPLRSSSDFVNATNTRDKFRVELEAQLFSPDEIEVDLK